ncbi:arylsulfatase B-like [Elysia marginata]|uniref:Arylsulfatase B-like n=1 Tax=Elysia marginata TaxID=1093978 RepID=A0AAV4IHB6_9GAST|nr:arylsulfatase B-like [Elysia marginata]
MAKAAFSSQTHTAGPRWPQSTETLIINRLTRLDQLTQWNTLVLFHAVDWFPTFLEIAGAPSGIDGISRWRFLREGGSSARTEFVYNIEPNSKGAIRVGDFKFIVGRPGQYNDWYPAPGKYHIPRSQFRGGKHDKVKLEKVPHMLFNITEDPREERNVAGDFPDVVKELSARFAAWNVTKVKPHSARRVAQSDPSLYGGLWSSGWC